MGLLDKLSDRIKDAKELLENQISNAGGTTKDQGTANQSQEPLQQHPQQQDSQGYPQQQYPQGYPQQQYPPMNQFQQGPMTDFGQKKGGMFSPELENLIQATLEDGVLEDYEKAALVKRAQAEGVDLAELEIYINSILQRRQKELEKEKNIKAQKKAQERKEALGRICPNCGKPVPPMTLKCECGFEFNSANQNLSSVQMLSDKIEAINSRPLPKKNKRSRKELKERAQEKQDIITMYAVPNTKEDIIEFCSMAVSLSKPKGGILGTIPGRVKILVPALIIIALIIGLIAGAASSNGYHSFGAVMAETALMVVFYGGIALYFFITRYDLSTVRNNMVAQAWRAKLEQVILKGRSLRGDSDFQQQLDYFENMINK